MRVAPVALATLGRPDAAVEWTLGQRRITHHHPLSDAASLTLVRMVQALISGQGVRSARSVAETLIAAQPAFAFAPRRGLSTAFIVDTMRTVLHGFFGATSFSDCLVETVNQGGDADTTGALAGMLAGAAYGPAAIPREWLARLDKPVVAEIRRQVPQLLALAPATSP
jgi:ADP-ribosyl-[dinitrogen reductase] hydrolase